MGCVLGSWKVKKAILDVLKSLAILCKITDQAQSSFFEASKLNVEVLHNQREPGSAPTLLDPLISSY